MKKNGLIMLGGIGLLVLIGIAVLVLLNSRPLTDADYIEQLVPPRHFPSDVWTRKQADAESFSRTTVELNRQQPTSLVYLDFLRFDASTPQPETALIASQRIDDAWIAKALSSYNVSRRVKSCTFGDIRLYEYDAIIDRIAYNLRYWVIPITPVRTATLIVAVTVDNRPYFDELSKTLRPNEAGCP